jgi:hypothetical protein
MQMAKQAEQRRMMGALLSRSFTVPQNPVDVRRAVREAANRELSAIESIALEAIIQIAVEGREATQVELCAATGVKYQQGTLPAVLRRLEKAGCITRKIYQRGMQLFLNGTDLRTREPKNTTPHWTHRKDRVPTPAIHQVRVRSKSLASKIEATAKVLSKPLHEFLMDCTYVGFHQIEAEIAAMEANDASEDQVGETQ